MSKTVPDVCISISGAGTGGLGLTIEGPSEAKVVCKDNRDGSCTVEYVPTEPGDYDVSIKFADQHIAGSPFSVSVYLKQFKTTRSVEREVEEYFLLGLLRYCRNYYCSLE